MVKIGARSNKVGLDNIKIEISVFVIEIPVISEKEMSGSCK